MSKNFTLANIVTFSFLVLFSQQVFSQINFNTYQATSVGKTFAQTVAIADFNNDGRNDIALGTGYYFDPANDYSVFVFLQNSSGALNAPVQYRYPVTYPGLRAMDAGDVNNDGLSDVIIGYDDSVGIFFQSGSGTLGNFKGLYSGQTVDGVKVGDLNNDGLNDIVASNWNASYISVYIQGPGGTFTKATYSSTQAGYDEIDIGDINNDGLKDVVLMSGQSYGGIHVFIQNGSGTLNAEVTYPLAGINMHGLGIGDLNNDGRMDVVTSSGGNSPKANINIWLQDAGTYLLQSSPTSISAYDIPEPLEVADLNCDGKNEIITAHGGWNNMSVYTQNGSGQYGSYQKFGLPYASHYKPEGLAIGDINSDGKKDVVIADYNQGLVILINTSSCGLQPLDGVTLGTNATCQNKKDGSATVTPSGGTSPYKYLWSTVPAQTTQTVTGLGVGTYNVTITDDSAKTKVVQVTISGAVPAAASVSIAPSTNNVCSDSVTFNAAQTNGGISPVYQWKVNGNPQGSNNPVFTSKSLQKGDIVTCEMTSSISCVTPTPAISNPVTMMQVKVNNAGSISSVPDTVCANAVAHILSTGYSGNQFQWQTGNSGGSMSNINNADTIFYDTPPLPQSTYYRLIAGTGKCADTSSLFLIQVAPAPRVNFTTTASGLKISFQSQILSGNVVTYLWDFGDGKFGTTKDVEHTFDSAGSYYVCLNAYNSTECSFSFCSTVEVLEGNGVPYLDENNGWQVYPNPFNTAFYIKSINSNTKAEQITVCDILGRQLDLQISKEQEGLYHINLAELPAGMYFIQIKAAGNAYVQPIVKQN